MKALVEGKKILVGAVLAVAIAAGFIGCAKKESAAVTVDSDVVMTNAAAAEQSTKLSKIVVLAPSDAEIVYAIGAGEAVIARTDYCDYPAEILALPSVGGYSADSISVEAVAAMEPELVVGSAGMHDMILSALADLGVNTYSASSNSIDEVYTSITELGVATGHEAEANALVASMKSELAKYSTMNASKGTPTVYYEVWNAPYMTCGSSSYINQIIEAAGAKNAFGDIESAYPSISEEDIIARDPAVILLPASNGGSAEDVLKRAGWDKLTAVRNGKVYIVNDDLYSRPGPRVVEAVRNLSDMLFGND